MGRQLRSVCLFAAHYFMCWLTRNLTVILTSATSLLYAGSVVMLNIGVVLVVNGLYVISIFCYSQAVQAFSTLLQVVSLSMCGI